MIYKVQVGFSKDILEIKENIIHIGIKSKPIKGEANKEMIKKIAKHFGISTALIQIKSGNKSKEKIIEILQ
jgi:hypothetical protein